MSSPIELYQKRLDTLIKPSEYTRLGARLWKTTYEKLLKEIQSAGFQVVGGQVIGGVLTPRTKAIMETPQYKQRAEWQVQYGNQPQANVPTPPWTTPEPPKPTVKMKIVLGGDEGILLGDDGKYYDLLTQLEIDDLEVERRKQSYAAAQEASKLAKEEFEWRKQQAEEEKRRRDYLDQIERERQEAEARNKAWSLAAESRRLESETAIEKQRNELELIKGRSFPFPYEQGNRQAYQQMQASAFESARQSILGSLTSPADWIKRWEVQNAPNPYPPQPQSPLESRQDEAYNAETRAKMFDQMATESENLVATLSADPNYAIGPNSPIEASVLTQARNDATNYRVAAEAERGRLATFQADVNYLQGQPQPAPAQQGRTGTAPAPGWLPAFAPGQRVGQGITRENVATPSAQQWAATPWTVQQGLSGYLDWAGYRPMADVLGNMAQMLPNAPGGGSRWSPLIGR